MIGNKMFRLVYNFLQVLPNAIQEWQGELAHITRKSSGPIYLNRKCHKDQYFLVEQDPDEQVLQIWNFFV